MLDGELNMSPSCMNRDEGSSASGLTSTPSGRGHRRDLPRAVAQFRFYGELNEFLAADRRGPVIDSMTSSSPQDAPREMEFRYNRFRFNIPSSLSCRAIEYTSA